VVHYAKKVKYWLETCRDDLGSRTTGWRGELKELEIDLILNIQNLPANDKAVGNITAESSVTLEISHLQNIQMSFRCSIDLCRNESR
jgi:hypothetical protein